MFVQNIGTGLYVRSDRAWVREQDQPLLFPDAATASTFCERHDLTNVRLVPDRLKAELQTFGDSQHSAKGRSRRDVHPFAQHAALSDEVAA